MKENMQRHECKKSADKQVPETAPAGDPRQWCPWKAGSSRHCSHLGSSRVPGETRAVPSMARLDQLVQVRKFRSKGVLVSKAPPLERDVNVCEMAVLLKVS